MIKRNGFAQIPLMIALLLMAIAIPMATKMVQQEQDNRNMAAGKTCVPGNLGTSCTNSKGETCQTYRNADCTTVCNKNCAPAKTCTPGNLGTSCTNDKGQKCQLYRNANCSTVCNQNCSGAPVEPTSPPRTATSTPVPGGTGCSETTRPKTSCVVSGVTYAWTCNAVTKQWSCQGPDVCSETTRPKTSCVVGGVTYAWTCNVGVGTWECKATLPVATVTPIPSVVSGNSCPVKNSTKACVIGGKPGKQTCVEAGWSNPGFFVWSSCVETVSQVKVCGDVKDATECAYIPGCNWNATTKTCTGTYPTAAPSCSTVKNSTECAYIPGCYWYNNACSGVKPTIAPLATAVPTKPSGGGGGGTVPTVAPTKPPGGGGGGGTCTNECPSSDGVLRSCDPVEGHSICNAVGRIESCGGQKFCCPTVGGAWTTDMAKCPVATPTVVAGTEPVLKFRMAFYGINTAATCALSKDLPLSVIVRNNDGTNKTYTGVIATKVDNTSGNLAYYDVTLRLVGFKQTGKFSVFVKSPKHLQVKYGINNQGEYYNKAGGELDGMTSDPATTPVFSFEKYPLLAGDVTGPDGKQDGVVDGRDFALVKAETVKRTEVSAGGYMLSDLNGNCKMESQDLSILMISLSVKQGQLY